MIFCRRIVEFVSEDDLPAGMSELVDRVLMIGGWPCSMIATRTSQPMVMTVGHDRASALRRLGDRLGVGQDGPT